MLLLALAASAFAVASPEAGNLNQCLDDMSTTLERSGEPGRDVAQAVVDACRVGRVPRKPGTIGAQMTFSDYQDAMSRIREAAASQVLRKIIRIRACRHTRGCDIAAIHLRDGAEVAPSRP